LNLNSRRKTNVVGACVRTQGKRKTRATIIIQVQDWRERDWGGNIACALVVQTWREKD